MFGIRTPPKPTAKVSEHPRSPKAPAQTSNVRRSIGEWEAAKNDTPTSHQPTTSATQSGSTKAKPKQTLSQQNKITTRRASTEAEITSPPKAVKYISKTAEARAYQNKAKLHLNNSKNLKTDIKAEVTQAVDRLYNIVKELEEENKGKKGKEITPERSVVGSKKIVEKMEEHSRMLSENNRKIEELKLILDEQKGSIEKITYASVTAAKTEKRSPVRSALHSIVVTSEQETDTGEVVLNKVREAMDAKQGWVKVDNIRKAKDRKIIMSCSTKEEREKVKRRLENSNKNLIVEEVVNKDPLIILRDVLLINSDEDVLKAMKNQNKGVFEGLEEGEDRLAIKYRRKARNPHTGHIVVSTSPRVWRRVVDAGALHIDLQHVRVADQSPLVQCSRCLAYGHTKRLCKEFIDLCSHCGGPHLKTECADWLAGAEPACRNCLRASLGRVGHNAFSYECPVRKRWDALARSAIAYC